MTRQIIVTAVAVLVLAVSFGWAQGGTAPATAPVPENPDVTMTPVLGAASQPVLTGAALELDKIKSLLKLPRDATEPMLMERLNAVQPAVEAMEKAYPNSEELPEAEMIALIAASQLARSNADMKMAARVEEIAKKIQDNPRSKVDFKMLSDAHLLMLKFKPPTTTAPSTAPAAPAEVEAFRQQIGKFLSKYDKGESAIGAITLAMQMYQTAEDYESSDKLVDRVLTEHPESRIAQAVTAMRNQSFSATLTKLDGAKINLPQDLNGQVAVVYFWASSYLPSTEHMAALADLYKKYHDKGLQVLTISLDQEKAALEDYLKKNENPFINTFSGEQMDSTAMAYGVRALPSVILVGKDGKIRSVSILSMPELDYMVNKALQAPASAPASAPAVKPVAPVGAAK